MTQQSIRLLAVLLALSSGAAASPTYPAVVADVLDLDSAPNCTLCHETAVGGEGTATKPVARSLVGFGLTGRKNEGRLMDALADLESESTDSDNDGKSDVDELGDGTDPNREGSAGGDDQPEPEVEGSDTDSGGCHVSRRPAGPGSPLLALLTAAGLALSLRKRRSR